MKILITGGTGSFGRKFVEIMLKEYHPKRLVIQVWKLTDCSFQWLTLT